MGQKVTSEGRAREVVRLVHLILISQSSGARMSRDRADDNSNASYLKNGRKIEVTELHSSTVTNKKYVIYLHKSRWTSIPWRKKKDNPTFLIKL